MVSFEDIIKQRLTLRGFTQDQILNNKGLISATIEETTTRVYEGE